MSHIIIRNHGHSQKGTAFTFKVEFSISKFFMLNIRSFKEISRSNKVLMDRK